MDSFEGGDASSFVEEEAPRMDEWRNPRWIIDASIHSFNRRRRCTREDDEGETRRRTGEEKIFPCRRVARARARRVAGSKRREIDEDDDGC